MLSFPNAKINIGLQINNKRTDGYHDISTCMYSIKLYDALEIIPSTKLSLRISGLEVKEGIDENTCLKAYYLLKSEFELPFFSIHLLKNIPLGAGLGGGSADGAFLLKMLNDFCKLGLNTSQLEAYAGRIGSDCPFFIQNKPVLAKETGTFFSEAKVDLATYFFVIIKPPIHVSTAWAYRNVKIKVHKTSLEDSLKLPIEQWRETIVNDFESSVFLHFPQLKAIKTFLYESGAIFASMSGSGSSLYGIFNFLPDIGNFKSFGDVFVLDA